MYTYMMILKVLVLLCWMLSLDLMLGIRLESSCRSVYGLLRDAGPMEDMILTSSVALQVMMMACESREWKSKKIAKLEHGVRGEGQIIPAVSSSLSIKALIFLAVHIQEIGGKVSEGNGVLGAGVGLAHVVVDDVGDLQNQFIGLLQCSHCLELIQLFITCNVAIIGLARLSSLLCTLFLLLLLPPVFYLLLDLGHLLMSMSGSSDGLTQEVLEGVYVEVGIYLSWLMMDSKATAAKASARPLSKNRFSPYSNSQVSQ